MCYLVSGAKSGFRFCGGNQLCCAEPFGGQETNFHALVKRPCDALQQREGVPLVIGVLETANGRSRRSDALSKFALCETCFGSWVVDLSRVLPVEALLLIGSP